MTNDEAEQKLREYQQAIEEEFAKDTQYMNGEADPVAIRERTRELMQQAVPHAVARLRYLIDHAKNESVQYKAAVFVIERAAGKDIALMSDPIEELLRKVSNADSS